MIKDKKMRFHLESGAVASILMFEQYALEDPSETHIIYEYWYKEEDYNGGGELMINDYRLTLDYADGKLKDKFKLTMHIIFPDRSGKQYLYGVDVSPNSKTFIEFTYERDGENFKLAEIGIIGVNKRVGFHDDEEALVKLIDFPCPILNVIEPDCGYSVPYLHNDGDTHNFSFKDSIINHGVLV